MWARCRKTLQWLAVASLLWMAVVFGRVVGELAIRGLLTPAECYEEAEEYAPGALV